MTIQHQLEQQLSNLGSGGSAMVAANDGPRQVSCDVVERNSLAVSFNSLRLETTELASADAPRLERIGTALAARLTYLMEPIAPIEVDAGACTVQLRSSPPQRDDDGRSYYELMVRRGGEVTLARYRKENGDARRQIAATVTREVLLRLVGDFCAVLE
jgi:hypothetical protein